MAEADFAGQMQCFPPGEAREKMNNVRHWLMTGTLALAGTYGLSAEQAFAASAAQLNADGKAALSRLYAQSDRATRYARDAHAILVFPKIVKAGLLIGGQGGEGVLFVH